jgi:hypothetical protein
MASQSELEALIRQLRGQLSGPPFRRGGLQDASLIEMKIRAAENELAILKRDEMRRSAEMEKDAALKKKKKVELKQEEQLNHVLGRNRNGFSR